MSAEFFPAVRSLVWAARSQISSKYDRKIVQNMRTTKWAHHATHVSIPQRDNSRVCLNDSEASVFSAIALRKQYSWCIWQTDWAKQSLSSTSYLLSHPILFLVVNLVTCESRASLSSLKGWEMDVQCVAKTHAQKKVRTIIKEKNSTVGKRQKEKLLWLPGFSPILKLSSLHTKSRPSRNGSELIGAWARLSEWSTPSCLKSFKHLKQICVVTALTID